MPTWWNWQTRTTQNRVPQGMWVRFPPSALSMDLFYDIVIIACVSATVLPAVILLYHRRKHPESWEYKNKNKSALFAATLLIGTFFLFYGSFVEPNLLTVNRQIIDLPGLEKPLKIALISDIHVGDFNKESDTQRIADLILSLNPDLVFVDGDHIFGNYKDDNRIDYLKPLGQVAKKIPTYAVHGNHEYGVGLYDSDIKKRFKLPNKSAEIAQAMRNLGVRYLINETEKITVNGESFLLFGGDEFLIDAVNYESLDKAKLENPELPIIALIHNPTAIYEASKHGIDLVLSGHTHGGQVRLPFIGPAGTIETDLPHAGYQGLVEYNGSKLFVTSGANESGARLRLFNPPEIVLLTIQ